MIPPSTSDSHSWNCDSCHSSKPSSEVDGLIHDLERDQKSVLGDPKHKKVKTLEKLLQKWGKKLDSRNLLIVRLKYNLVGLYGRQSGYTQGEMTEQLWTRKKELCDEVLESLKYLEPGMTVRKARLMQELHLPLLMLAQIHMGRNEDKNKVKKEFQRGLVILGLATRVFEAEPEDSWERQTAIRNKETTLQVQQIMAGL